MFDRKFSNRGNFYVTNMWKMEKGLYRDKLLNYGSRRTGWDLKPPYRVAKLPKHQCGWLNTLVNHHSIDDKFIIWSPTQTVCLLKILFLFLYKAENNHSISFWCLHVISIVMTVCNELFIKKKVEESKYLYLFMFIYAQLRERFLG